MATRNHFLFSREELDRLPAKFKRLNPALFPPAPDPQRVPDLAPPMAAKSVPYVQTKARSTSRQRGKESAQTESQIQQSIIEWWHYVSLARCLPGPCLMAFPLQGLRTKRNGSRLKAEGMRAGTPDLFLALARGKYHGLWIELKRPGGKLRPSQKAMLDMLDLKCGYAAFACYGQQEAQALIVKYLNGEEFF
jgi:hypothetical protein